MNRSMQNIDRRKFLGAVAGAGTLANTRILSGAPADSDGFKLGVASYSLRKFSRTQAIAMVKQLNTPYLSIKEFHLPISSTPEEIARGRKEFEDAGIVVLSGGVISFPKDDDADIRHKFEYAKAAGMPMITCMPTAKTLPKVEKMVKEFDIRMALHNHGKTDKNFPSPQSALKAIDGMDPRCGLCIDVGHTAEIGVDVVESIRMAGSRLLDVHIKDVSDLSNADSQVPVGEGRMPIPAIFRELKKLNYRGGVMLEYEIDENNPMPGMAKSFAYMRGVLAGMQS
jgi:sugar phosphate isomerase/epimerase